MYKILALAAATIWLAVLALPDKNLHLVFCDVGQGDAILVSLGTNQLLVDGGPGKTVLECLARHMPFYDHRIEVMVSTHTHADHLTGLLEAQKKYAVLNFVREPGEVRLGPIRLPLARAEGVADENDRSLTGRLEYGDFDVWLTGDVNTALLTHAEPAEILKVPHHGSKYGLTVDWLNRVRPYAAIISVGKRNPYGHPAEETLKLLRDEGIKILRTDVDGEVEIVSDGKTFWIK